MQAKKWTRVSLGAVFLTTLWLGTVGASIGIMGVNIGDSIHDVMGKWGEPLDRYSSAYGYETVIYYSDDLGFAQLAVLDGVVQEIYSNSQKWSFRAVKVGTPGEEAWRQLRAESYLEFVWQSITFMLDQDIDEEGFFVALLEDSMLAQVHLDIHDEAKVTSIRLSHPDVYVVRGGLGFRSRFPVNNGPPDPPELSYEEQELVLAGEARTNFYHVNSWRDRFGLEALAWVPVLAELAAAHSKDMSEQGFFAHVSPTTGSMSDRLEEAGFGNRRSGENIATGQRDAVYANESWMNSIGHRSNILNPAFSGLGVGVFDLRYTHKFIDLQVDEQAKHYMPYPLMETDLD